MGNARSSDEGSVGERCVERSGARAGRAHRDRSESRHQGHRRQAERSALSGRTRLGFGGYPGNRACDIEELRDQVALGRWKQPEDIQLPAQPEPVHTPERLMRRIARRTWTVLLVLGCIAYQYLVHSSLDSERGTPLHVALMWLPLVALACWAMMRSRHKLPWLVALCAAGALVYVLDQREPEIGRAHV